MLTTTGADVRIVSQPLGGSPLSRLAQGGGTPPDWYPRRPPTPDHWRALAEETRGSVDEAWWSRVEAACAPGGPAAARIERVVREGGVVVTTGQQPGLFGGPAYTWVKAVSALALADALEASAGIPVAPLFWAATDDADFLEAAWTMVPVPGGAERLALAGEPTDGIRLADVPLGDIAPALERLERACGSVADARALDAVRRSYGDGVTIGTAYVGLLRALLQPLGITVLDAAHPALSRAAHPCLIQALERRDSIREGLHARHEEIVAAGLEPQVSEVEGRTLVFHRSGPRRQRVSHELASEIIRSALPGELAPNVLLRPVVERALVPTVAYVAGPGEIAYFAQSSAVADALGRPRPLPVPRWSTTLIEPHIASLLERYGVTPDDFADPHAIETRFARAEWPAAVSTEFAALRELVAARAASLRGALDEAGGLVAHEVVDGMERGVAWRLARLERRITAAVKRRGDRAMQDLGTLRGALYPGGVRQERAMNLVPTLSRHGLGLLDRMREAAMGHARDLTGG